MSGFRAKDGEGLGQGQLVPFPRSTARASPMVETSVDREALGARMDQALDVVRSAAGTIEEMQRRTKALEAEASRQVAYHRDRAESATREVTQLRANYDKLSALNASLTTDFENRRLGYEEKLRRQDVELSRLKADVRALNDMIGGFNRQVEELLGKAPAILAECGALDDRLADPF